MGLIEEFESLDERMIKEADKDSDEGDDEDIDAERLPGCQCAIADQESGDDVAGHATFEGTEFGAAAEVAPTVFAI